MKQSTPAISRFSLTVIGVSVYLSLVGLWLLLTRRISSSILSKILRASFRSPYAAAIHEFTPDQGYCFKSTLPAQLLSDLESASRVRLYEDGVELGPAHSSHEQVRRLGRGRFSHWGVDLYYSTSDNSDPRTNGRRYEIREST